MKKLVVIFVSIMISGFFTSCIPLFYPAYNDYPNRRYHSDYRYDNRGYHDNGHRGRHNKGNRRNHKNSRYNDERNDRSGHDNYNERE